MKKFTCPSIAVISLNADESVMNGMLTSGNEGVETVNVVTHNYVGEEYNMWKKANDNL